MPEVAYHRAFVDEQAVENLVAALFERFALPDEFAGIGDDAAADCERLDIVFDYARGQQVQFDSAGGVAGICAAVYFYDYRGDVFSACFGL